MSDYDLFAGITSSDPVWGFPTGKGGVLRTHPAGKCSGEFCCLHNPSNHPLKDAPLNWRADRRMMERICAHGIGHPDPDDVAHTRRTIGTADITHGCDGCCAGEEYPDDEAVAVD